MSDFLTTQEHVSSYVDDLSRKEGWFIFSAWVWNALVFWLAMVIMSALIPRGRDADNALKTKHQRIAAARKTTTVRGCVRSEAPIRDTIHFRRLLIDVLCLNSASWLH